MLSSQSISLGRSDPSFPCFYTDGSIQQSSSSPFQSFCTVFKQPPYPIRVLNSSRHGHAVGHKRHNSPCGSLITRKTSRKSPHLVCRSAVGDTPVASEVEEGHAALPSEGNVAFQDLAHGRGGEEGDFAESESVAAPSSEGANGAGVSVEAGEWKEGGGYFSFWFRFLQQWHPWKVRKHLQSLKERADAKSSDPAAAALYLAQLNKADRPDDVIAWFDERGTVTGADAVVEYLKALVKTGRISDYLPGSDKGDSLALPALFQELKVKANPECGDHFPPPGISPKHPIHTSLVGTFAPQSTTGIWGLLFRTFSLLLTLFMASALVAAGLRVYGSGVASMGGANSSGQQGAGGAAASGTYAPKEYSKEIVPEKNVKTFKDVKGCDEAKAEVEEIVQYLKNPSKFTRLGGKLPKGVLLVGPPGNGKTLLAKAIAGEAGVPFYYRSGSEFEEMFVGVGAKRVRTLFQVAKKKAPCIVFIDEIDAIGGRRSRQWDGHSTKTLNQLLVEMDGFEDSEGVIVIAATNLPDSLDPALTRPGRFDRHVAVAVPDVRGREQILALYFEGKPVSPDVDLKVVARGTPGFSGADLSNLVNEAAVKAAKDDSASITTFHLEYAKDKILMGAERKSMVLTEEGRKLTAYHESGHAVVALHTVGANPIHKATIMPRGHALGYVAQLPAADETSLSKEQMLAQLDVCMGGRVAEEMVFGAGKVTSGATSDLRKATSLARHMVCECGMSDEVGPLFVDERSEGVSAATRKRVDDGVMALLRGAYGRVQELLRRHEGELHKLANALLERETLTAEEIHRVVEGKGEEVRVAEAGLVEELVGEGGIVGELVGSAS